MIINGAANDSQLADMVMPQLEKVVDYVVKKILEENRDIVEKVVYDAYEPTEYDRTGEFKEAWDTEVRSSGDTVTGEFKYDPSKISHRSIVDGSEVGEYLADIIYHGFAGAIYQQGYAKNSVRFKGQAWTKARNAWDSLIKYLGTNRMARIFEEGMQYYGIPYERNSSHGILQK